LSGTEEKDVDVKRELKTVAGLLLVEAGVILSLTVILLPVGVMALCAGAVLVMWSRDEDDPGRSRRRPRKCPIVWVRFRKSSLGGQDRATWAPWTAFSDN
jgi:hypothetical protein